MPKLVFITGASSGIGQALAWQFYQDGYSLALVARGLEPMLTWAAERQIDAARCHFYTADVRVNASIIAAATQCIAQQGLPDVVIANAGISIGMDSAIASDLDVMADIMATNVLGVAATFHPFIRPMCERKSGHLVGIASVAGIRGLAGHGAYCASKAAVISYCESVRGELRSQGVRVQTICPGFIDTPLTQHNPYRMPFLMQAADFARKAIRTIERRRSYCVIPWQMAWAAAVLRILPNAVFDKLFATRARKHRLGAHPTSGR